LESVVERETFVHFIGVFDDLSILKEQMEHLITTTKTKRSDYVVKSVLMNTSYDYVWSNMEVDEVKTI
jgi:hypothetical protein